ncbi:MULTISPECIES: XRE family transcriptional regulator [Paracoccus]|uniref:XRE family transcriptional regulator n=1 Tax=Paracoccus TaxID=265 RepID=UPI00254ADC57|nr:LexA family transcriptional regulator [Paracoccus sp. SSJ]MDK8874709.1 S24 family peptidase [Paracoccus sp. SSJ]
MKLKIGKILAERGLKQRWLVEQLDVSPGYVSNLVAGTKRPSAQMLERIAEVFELPASAILEDQRPVAVAGKVGAGNTVVELVDAYAKGGGLYHVAAPDDLPSSGIVAVEVAGDSMSPLIEPGDIVFFTRHFVGIDPAAIGHVSICQTDDGRALIKQIRRGREEGTFDLYSVNSAHPPEYGVRLVWAAPWRRAIRRQDVEFVDP